MEENAIQTSGDGLLKFIGNRLVYVDPNDVYGFDKDKKVPFTPPYEDMCIAFNLVIEKYDRFDNSVRKEIGMEWTDKPNGENNSYFSILDGELKTKDNHLWTPHYDKNGKLIDNCDESYLTTYYTEISADGYKKKEMVEGLGVQSIQVSFDSYYTPTVVIKFIDVRGSALFGREEAIHSDASGSGVINANNIFGAFFTIPYPKFRLQIKGFYGRDVTYQLTCSGFKANFNSQTGNVEATANFVGYSWSLLTDIPLAYLIAAPFCEYEGAAYWEAHEDSTAWRMDNTAQSAAHQLAPPKMFEFFNAIRGCMKDANTSESVGNTYIEENKTYSNERQTLEELKRLISKFEQLTASKKKTDIDSKKKDIMNVWSDILRTTNEYSNSYTSAGIGFPSLDKEFYTDKDGDEYDIYDFSTLKAYINDTLTEIEEVNKENLTNEKRQFVIKSLTKIGIDPNIKNIFKMLMCHLETFCHILFKAASEIEDQKKKGERNAGYLGLKIDNTDVPDRFGDTTPLPAWTAVFNHRGNSMSTDELKYTEMFQWVGNISDKWIEEKVVLSFQKAIQYTALPLKKEENTTNNNGEWYQMMQVMPYNMFNEKLPFNTTPRLTFSTICGNLAFRAAQIFGVMDNTLENDITIVKTIGEMDAYNYYLSCNSIDDIKTYLLDKINNGNATSIITGVTTCNNAYDSYCKLNENGRSYHSFELDRRNSDAKRQPLFTKENNEYKYVYFNDINNQSLIPSILTDFRDRGYNTYIKPTSDINNDLYYEGTTTSDRTKGWLYTADKQTENKIFDDGCRNYDMFSIIDDSTLIDKILKSYENTKTGQFKVNDYEVDNVDGFSKFADRYWHLSYEDYKESLPGTVHCTFIGKTYKTHIKEWYKNEYGKEAPNPLKINKNMTFKSKGTAWVKLLDNDFGNTVFHIGDDYGKLKLGDEVLDIDKDLFIKALYVLHPDGSSFGTLFGNPFYYTQNQIEDNDHRLYAKAFLFLQSLRRPSKYFRKTFNTEHGSFTLYNKLNILYIGGLLWRQKYYDENQEDGIMYKNLDENGNEVGQQYEPRYKDGKILTLGGCRGLFIVKKGEKAEVVTTTDSAKKWGDMTISFYINHDQTIQLDKNVKEQLIDYFENFARTDFAKIAAECELYTITTDGEYAAFANGKQFQDRIDGLVSNGQLGDNAYVYANELTALYGKSYAFFYINRHGTKDNMYGLFDEDTSTEIQKIIKDVYFGKVIVMNTGSVNKPKDGIVKIKSNVYETYLSTLVDTLRKIYDTKKVTDEPSTEIKDKNDNLLLAIYLYCKNIWEGWLVPLSGKKQGDEGVDENNENYFDVSNFFKNFVFIDSYYNDIGRLLKINLDTLLKSYEGRAEGGNLFSFIGDIVADHRCIFVPLPDFVDMGLGIDRENSEGLEKMKDLFRPLPYSKMGKPRMDNHFVVIYTYPPSSKLPDSLTYKFDGFDLYATDAENNPFMEVNNKDNATDSDITKYGYSVPSFAVAFGKQNNHLFKNFTISMDNPVETEQSIKTLYHVAELAKGNDRKICFHGQDVYNIFSNYSYQIEVEMMGNAQIQPLMYFQLLNIPMWRGAYMIFKVSHTMTPGNMTTRFTAMKMSKHPVPIVSSYWTWIDTAYIDGYKPIGGNGGSSGSYAATSFKDSGQYNSIENKRASSLDMDAFTAHGYCPNVDKKYFNRGHNNYYTYNYDKKIFKMNNGKEFNLEHAINFIYNMAHLTTVTFTKDKTEYKACTPKPPTMSSGRCARHVWCALQAGGLTGLNGGDAWEDTTRVALQKVGGFEQIYSAGQDLPTYAMPGDIVLKSYKNSEGKPRGHAEFFTGMHWVSDAIQETGLKWARGYNTAKEDAYKEIYAIWRVPGIEEIMKKEDSTNSPDGFPTDAQLLYMLKHAEGESLYKWAYSETGNAITWMGVDGYDLAGGVHSKEIAKEIGQTPASCIGRTSLDGIKWKKERPATEGEKGEKHKNEKIYMYTAYTETNDKKKNVIKAVNSYWDALIPHYRNKMKIAWQLNVVQQETDKGTRLAMCHTMYWVFGGKNNLNFAKYKKEHSSAWNGRLEWAKKAVSI